MAFLYPKLFPDYFNCVEETTSDPRNIRNNDIQIYPVGMPLEKAMALIWKSKEFNVSGTLRYPNECCPPSNVPAYSIWTFSGQTTSTTPLKMSELACNFSADYSTTSFRINYKCNGSIESSGTEEESFGLGGFDNSIYLYNKLYYIPIYYFFASGQNLDEANNFSYYNGSVTIDGVILPLYAQEPNCYPISADIILTTSSEREAN